ncbi:MAG: glycogen debranching protein [Anaerolineae bacterium]|nr:MAG: glycogen debranching protein [Anaerolineae bacterium]
MQGGRVVIHFGREITSKTDIKREWLVTNGMGGYAMGTINLTRTRTYHGFLVAATQPPTGRTMLLAGLDIWLDLQGYSIPFVTHEWSTGVMFPDGYSHLESFYLDGLLPVWEWVYRNVKFIQRVWMPQGKNTTYITYTYTRGQQPVKLTVKPLVTYRSHHHTTKGGAQVHVTPIQWEGGKGLDILPMKNLSSRTAETDPPPSPFKILTNATGVSNKGDWWWKFHLATEKYRGQDDVEDLYQAGVIEHTFNPGDTLCLIATMDVNPPESWEDSLHLERQRQKQLRESNQLDNALEWVQQLGLAADQFIVERKIDDIPGKTIIAGYPWFTDWGRDTMVALPGLMLATRRYEEAAQTLLTYSRFVDMGMLPNRFPDTDISPEYNTADATLWYFVAIYEYFQAQPQDKELAGELYPTLARIIEWHKRGTRYHIAVDKTDHLLKQGEPQLQLTWMDVKVDNVVVTPRHGKAVEINALWYNALRIMGRLSRFLDKDPAHFLAQAEMVKDSFRKKFWYADGGYLYDVVDTPTGNDSTLRPNQLFAVSLPFQLLEGDQARSVVDVCADHLLGSYGLRSLSPDSPDYKGTYGGDVKKRDHAYHQGTLWAWLMGAFVTAHWRVYQDAQQAMNYLKPFADHMRDEGLGSIGEIFDGNAPHAPRGCPFQAWSVAEVLRCYRELEKAL